MTKRTDPMRWTGAATLAYGLASLAAAVAGYLKTDSVVALAAGGVAGLALLVCGRNIVSGKMPAGFVAAGIAMLLGLYFGYAFIATGSFLPGGAMLLVSFGALFVILIGMFLALAGRGE